MQNIYVFVVCGGLEHINTLHYSLPFLKKRTQNPIWVVSDSTRNESPVVHSDIIDVKVPAEYDNHQASIWLKTNLHKLLPKGNRYVYLDTDILAIGSQSDAIFEQFIPPIRFAADHCKMNQFSPYAVNCICLPTNSAFRDRVNALLEQQDPLSGTEDVFLLEKRNELQRVFASIKTNKLKVLFTAIRFFTSGNRFKLTKEFYFDKSAKVWCGSDGTQVMYQVDLRKIAKLAGLKYIPIKNDIVGKDGKSIWVDSCNHLAQCIENKFQISIENKNWQHWNGGVFLFSDESHVFMQMWHELTIEIFKDPEWKTRDQGTLIATAWKLGLQNHPVLEDTWNFIADYGSKNVFLNESKTAITRDANVFIHPEFIHIYHHFGDEKWDVWHWVTKYQ